MPTSVQKDDGKDGGPDARAHPDRSERRVEDSEIVAEGVSWLVRVEDGGRWVVRENWGSGGRVIGV